MIPEISSSDFLPVLPAIVLTVGAILVLISEVFQTTTARSHQAGLAVLFSVGAGALAFWTSFEPAQQVFNGMGVLDPFSSFLSVVVCVTLALAVLLAHSYLKHRNAERGEFYALMMFAAAGMSLLAVSAELITLFVNIEVLSISTYALTAYLRRGHRPSEAGFKYFILGAFSSAILLYGVALLYGATGTTKLFEMAEPLAEALRTKTALVYAGFALVGTGLAFKVAAVPFHMWTPDVYEGAPTPVTALMSAGVKAAAFAAMVRVCILLVGPDIDPRLPFLFFASLALLTMVGGNLLALPQRNVKRMLAYSSIAHAGYVLLGLAALFARPGGPSREGVLATVPLLGEAGPSVAQQDIFKGVLFYLLAYAVTALGAFGVLSALERREDETHGNTWDLDRFEGLAQRRPGWALAMAAFMLSLGGIPPTVGFMGKLLVFRAAVDAGLIGLAVVGVLSSAAGVYYYLRVVVYMFMRPAREGLSAPERQWGAEVALALSSVAVVVLGILPGTVTSWLSKATLLLSAR